MRPASLNRLALLSLSLVGCGGTASPTADNASSPAGASDTGAPSTARSAPPIVAAETGACMSGAPSFATAKKWAASFRLPNVSASAPPTVTLIEGAGPSALGFGDRRVETWLQIVGYAPAGGGDSVATQGRRPGAIV